MLNKDRPVPEKGKGSKLTPKMEAFVNEYLIDLNASQACLRAGYKTRSPHKMGTQLLNHPLVSAAVEARKDERRQKAELTADYVLNKLIALTEANEETNPTVAVRTLELLGRHLGLYKDRQEISGPNGEAIHIKEEEIKQNVADFTSKLSSLAARAGKGSVVEFPNGRGES
jgi:phage terminase small subunit